MYSFSSRVRYSEVDSEQNMTFLSLLNYFQDCCTFQSEDLGIGVDYLLENQIACVLSSWQVVTKRQAKMGEEITITTWPYDFGGFFGYRNFTVEDSAGKIIAYANSVWVFMDVKIGRPCKMSDKMTEVYKIEEKFSMDYAPRKIKIPKEAELKDSYVVQASQIDTNHHVNNEKYVAMAQKQLPVGYKLYQMRAEYKKAAVLGDTIFPYVAGNEDGTQITVVLADENAKPYAVIEFTA